MEIPAIHESNHVIYFSDAVQTSIQKNSRINDTQLFSFEPKTETIPVIAHRGYSSIAPENTLAAFYLAAEKGFSTVECDIRWTKDNVPVILHDSSINRTARTAGGNRIFNRKDCSDCTYNELLTFDFGIWKGKQYKGTKIPTFPELLQCSKDTGLNLYVEIKDSDNFDREKAQILVDYVKEAGLEDKITWISFNSDSLQLLSDLMPNSRIGLLSSDKVSSKTIETLNSLNNEENEVFIDIKLSKMNSYGDKLLDNAGYPFEVWTVDDVEDIDFVYDYECNGVTTNRITDDMMSDYLEEKNSIF